jgi:hypothetical protein
MKDNNPLVVTLEEIANLSSNRNLPLEELEKRLKLIETLAITAVNFGKVMVKETDDYNSKNS